MNARLFATAKDDYASTGVEGVVHHFIAEASQNIHRLRFSAPSNPRHPSSEKEHGPLQRERERERESKREREREREKERRRGRDI